MIDYSEWLTPDRLAVEMEHWRTIAGNLNLRRAAAAVNTYGAVLKLEDVVEFGCGPGILAAMLLPRFDYLGIDANMGCLVQAAKASPARRFLRRDVREWESGAPEVGNDGARDLVVAHAFLKHFGLHEWDEVAGIVFRAGRHAVFSLPLADVDRDDGAEFHHVHISPDRLERALAAAGLRVWACYSDAALPPVPAEEQTTDDLFQPSFANEQRTPGSFFDGIKLRSWKEARGRCLFVAEPAV